MALVLPLSLVWASVPSWNTSARHEDVVLCFIRTSRKIPRPYAGKFLVVHDLRQLLFNLTFSEFKAVNRKNLRLFPVCAPRTLQEFEEKMDYTFVGKR